MLRAVQVRPKRDTSVRYLAQIAEAEYLVAAGVRQDGVRPRHEPMQAAQAANQLMPWTQVEMISIRKNDLRAQRFQVLLCLGLYRGGGAHRHERRRLDRTMRSRQASKPCAGWIGRENFERKSHQEKAATMLTLAIT